MRRQATVAAAQHISPADMRGWAISTQFPLNRASDCSSETTDSASSVSEEEVVVGMAAQEVVEGMVVEPAAEAEEEMVEPVEEEMVEVAVV